MFLHVKCVEKHFESCKMLFFNKKTHKCVVFTLQHVFYQKNNKKLIRGHEFTQNFTPKLKKHVFLYFKHF